jgi:hypothetical protein
MAKYRIHAIDYSDVVKQEPALPIMKPNFPVKDHKLIRGSLVSTVTARQILFPAGSQPIFTTVLRPKWIKRPGPEAGYTPTVPNMVHKEAELHTSPPPNDPQ